MNRNQEKVERFLKEKNIQHLPQALMIDLVAEIGEVAKEILENSDYGKRETESSKELADEMGDAFYSLISLANYFGIDLDRTLDKTLEKYEERLKKGGLSSRAEYE
ncbi:MAG: nucleotide pyrophosphohydrolase [Candidatus Nealsonbacteria bacterium]|nr:nucleotide pyrophosphohydrolase [Candidatus Nealsonbacteria bacterium]